MKAVKTLNDYIEESKKDPEFLKEWKKSELPYQIGRQLIGLRMAKNLTQKQLAEKVQTTQAVISRIEHMSTNPSVLLLDRIAQAVGEKLYISFSIGEDSLE